MPSPQNRPDSGMTGGLTDPSPVTNRNGSAPNNSSPNQAPLRPRPQSAAANGYPSNHQRSRQQSAPAYFPNNSNTNPSNQDLSQLLSRLANVNRRRTTHQGRIIVRTADDGKYIMLDDSTVWKSEDESTSSGWSEGTEVIIASVFATLVNTCKRLKVNPYLYLRDIFIRIGAGCDKIDDLLPDRWVNQNPLDALEKTESNAATVD